MKKSTIVIASLLTASLASGFALAEKGKRDGDCEQRWDKARHHEFGGPHMKRGEFMQREFNADEIRTLAEARLLMQGNENLKVGDIKKTETGYSVAIVTNDGSLVEEREVARNGMPIEMYQRMQERMQERMGNQ